MNEQIELESKGHELAKLVDQGLDWLNTTHNLNRANKMRMHDVRRNLRKIVKVLRKKPVFAMYGASQVGKSYLAEIVLRGKKPDLYIRLGKEEVRFLEKINPTGGGAEATGVATRFTINPPLKEEAPVLVRFVSIEDICLIVCKAYYLNFSDNIPLDRSVIYEKIEELNTLLISLPLPPLPAPEEITYSVSDLEDSLYKYFTSQRTHWEDVKAAGLWDILHEHLPKLLDQPELLARLVSVLWMGHEGLTDLASTLFRGLGTLNWNEFGFLEASSVLREEFGGAAIVDVAALKSLGQADFTLSIHLNGTIVQLERSTVSALTKEIVLSVSSDTPKDEGDYLLHSDIMDFPGARSPIKRSGDSDDMAMPFLRGKVAHLFDQYSRDYEIKNLLFCIPDQKNEVTDLPQILNEWIKLNVGETPEERLKLIESRGTSPLMIIFTWFNRQLVFDATNDRVDTLDNKWEKRFKRFFEDEMVNKHEWAENWTPGTRFNNIFPLRDFSFSKETFSGYLESGVETGLMPIPPNGEFSSPEDFQAHLAKSFIESQWTQKYLSDPESSWQTFAILNQDGSQPIIEALQWASKSSGLEAHAKGVIERSKKSVKEELIRFYHSDDVADRHRKAEQLSSRLRLKLTSLALRKPEAIVAFQKALKCTPDKMCTWLDAQNYSAAAVNDANKGHFLMAHSFITEDMTPSQCVESFRAYYHLEDELTAEELAWTEWGIELRNLFQNSAANNSDPLVLRALEYLTEQLLVFHEDLHSELIQLGLEIELITGVFEQLKLGLDTRNIASRISVFIQGQPELIVMGQFDTRRLGALIAHQWNEFVYNLNASYYTPNELDKIRFQKIQRETQPNQVFALLNSMFGKEPMTRLPEVHDKPGLEAIQIWLEKLHNLFIVNCGFANYDIEANTRLAKILKDIYSI